MTSLPPRNWRSDREATEIVIGALQMPGMYMGGPPMDSYPGEGVTDPLWVQQAERDAEAQALMDAEAEENAAAEADLIADELTVLADDELGDQLVQQDSDHDSH